MYSVTERNVIPSGIKKHPGEDRLAQIPIPLVTKCSDPYLLREEIPPGSTSQNYILLTTFATSHFPCARVQCHEIHEHYKDYVVEEDVLVGYVVINDVKCCKGLSTPL